ncbi:hypothetical protein ES705_43180 [subsurface metagenome]
MPVTGVDQYANMYQTILTESAVTTLTYEEINLGLTLFQKRAILVSRIVIDWGFGTIGLLAATGDGVSVGLTQSNRPTSITLRDTSTIWKAEKAVVEYGTSANALIENMLDVYDLSDIPGGGEFIVPTPLYGAIQGIGIAAAASVVMRMYFTVVELKPEQYIELLEARHFFG